MFRACLVAAFVLLVSSTGSAQTLTAATNPSSGGAGVNNVIITGSGFPAGSITPANVTVSFGTTCAAPAVATTPATQVTAIASLRRFQVLIPGSLAPGNYKVWVSGMAGTATFNSLFTPSCSSLTVTSSVKGTASLGAAIVGGNVTLVDSQGTTRTGTTASDGSYSIDTTGLVPPFLVKVVTTADVPGFPAGTALYSVSADGNSSTRINANVVSDLILRSYYAAQGINPNDAFANPVGDPAPTPDAVASLAAILLPTLQSWLDQAGVSVTSGTPTGDAINVISSPLVAYPPGVTPTAGLDVVLHEVTGETLNPDGSVAALNVAAGTVTETINSSFSNGTATFTFATTDTTTGAGSAGSFSTVVLTPAVDPILDAINASFAAVSNLINTKGAALTGADLLPFYTSDYLQNGQNAVEDANSFASDVAGATISITAISIETLNSPLAKVVIRFDFQFNGESGQDTDKVDLKNDGGVWKLYGNQRVAGVGANVEARTFQGGAANPVGTINKQTDVFAGANAPHGLVTSVAVNGPTNNPSATIWQGLAARPLFQGAGFVNNGQLQDQWFLLSSPLGSTLSAVSAVVPPGSNFNFTLTTNGFGNPLYSAKSNVFTTENVQFLGLPAHMLLGTLVNHTINFGFTLPKTYSMQGAFLFAQIFNGQQNLPTTVSCSIGSSPLNLDFVNHVGTGSITFPADMSPCGLPGTPIAVINVFFEVDGVLGETSITFAPVPY